jgi:hypothetical protein
MPDLTDQGEEVCWCCGGSLVDPVTGKECFCVFMDEPYVDSDDPFAVGPFGDD